MAQPLSALLFPQRTATRTDAALLALRLVVGAAFILHGYGKIQHPFAWMGPDSGTPAVFQGLAALSEFGGGIAFLLGALTPVAALGIASTMAVAVLKHTGWGHPFVGQGGPSYELALVYLAIAGLLLVSGPGRFSVDAWLSKRSTVRAPETAAPIA